MSEYVCNNCGEVFPPSLITGHEKCCRSGLNRRDTRVAETKISYGCPVDTRSPSPQDKKESEQDPWEGD